jgi:hypothetical protein
MNDIEPRKEPVPTNVLAKQGVAAVAQIAGGLLILLMHGFSARLLPLGIVFGLVMGGLGLGAVLSKDPEDKKPGVILTVAGILKLLSHLAVPVIIRPIAGYFLSVFSLGLLAMGVWNGIRFLLGLKSRK